MKKNTDFNEFKRMLRAGQPAGALAVTHSAQRKTAPEEAAPEVFTEARPRRGVPDESGGRHEEPPPEREGQSGPQPLEPLCDPMGRALAQVAPRTPNAVEHQPPPATLLPELEQLLGRLVRRAAFGGDGRRGTARLEIGAGALAGATLLVEADAGELTIDVDLPPGAHAEQWRERLAERLAARGLQVREITVR